MYVANSPDCVSDKWIIAENDITNDATPYLVL